MANSLAISLEPESQEALLSFGGESRAWLGIRQICMLAAPENCTSGFDWIRVPWWVILQKDKSIAYQCRTNGVVVTFDSAAQIQLKAAKKYGVPGNISRVVSGEELYEELNRKGFSRRLKTFQERNVLALLKNASGADFSVPGSGKTTEALAVFAFTKSAVSKLLVICPKNAFAVWEDEIQECFSRSPLVVRRLTGGATNIKELLANATFDVGLMTYHQVPNVTPTLLAFLSKNNTQIYLDESHKIKRGDAGVIGRALLDIASSSKEKLILSGTPLPNSVADLVPQMRFLYPALPIDEKNAIDAIDSLYVRTTKDELNLKPPRRILVPIRMTDGQEQVYRLLCSEIARDAKRLRPADSIALRKLGKSAIRLIQLASNPGLLVYAQPDIPEEFLPMLQEDSPKFAYTVHRARQLAAIGQKVIIWTSFVSNVEILAERLTDLDAVYIHGGVEAGSEEEEDTREARIKKFHDDPKCMAMIANPAACGEGISLHKVCHHAIYVDRTYNAAHYLQSEDRIHRIGLDPSVETNIEILFCDGTVDSSINNRLNMKAQMMMKVLNDRSLAIDPVPLDVDDFNITREDISDFLQSVSKFLESA